MMTIDKQRSVSGHSITGKIGKHSLIDLNQFNDQYSNSMASNTYQTEQSSSFNETQFY